MQTFAIIGSSAAEIDAAIDGSGDGARFQKVEYRPNDRAVIAQIEKLEMEQIAAVVSIGRASFANAAIASAHTRLPVCCVPLENQSVAAAVLSGTGIAMFASLGDVVNFFSRSGNASPPRVFQNHGKPESDADAEKRRIQDEAWLQELSRNFKPRVVEEFSHPELPHQRPALDYSLKLREVISKAREIAAAYRNEMVTPEHFLGAILETSGCAGHQALAAGKMDLGALAARLEMGFNNCAVENIRPGFALDVRAMEMLARAKDIAREQNAQCLTTMHILHSAAELNNLDASAISADAPVLDECAETLQPPGENRAPDPIANLNLRQVAELQHRLFSAAKGAKPALKKEQTGARPPTAALPSRKTGQRKPAGTGAKKRSKSRAKSQSETSSENKASQISGNDEPIEPIKTRLIRCDAFNPPVDAIEDAADALLEGKIISFPVETMYVLAADATNRAAVSRLFALRSRPPDRAIGVMTHSATILKGIASMLPPGVEELAEAFWPGLLTIVLPRHASQFAAVAPTHDIGVRIPDAYTALSVMSMVSRPLAVTAAAVPGGAAPTAAMQVEKSFGGKVAIILDAGSAEPGPLSTVLSVVTHPFKILRSGAVPKAEIERVLGMNVEG